MSATFNLELTSDELDTLDDFLYSDTVSEESLDLVGVHGLFTACNISPKKVEEADWYELIFDEEPQWESSQQKDEILGLLRRLYQFVHSNLYSDQEIDLPLDLTLEPEEDEEVSALTWWCQAFMEGVFLNEDAWFNHQQEEEVAESLLPIMVLSDLFNDDPEMKATRKNEKACEEMAQQVPDLLVDLFLLFHAPAK
ncbi:MAG: UPF0149 family protein [Pontibacterium sp.]